MGEEKHYCDYCYFYFSRNFVFLVSALMLLFPCDALEFDVGGSDGWVLNPSESYDHWANRMRFQVNDSLVFRYDEGQDTVLEVKGQDDYEKCNTQNPIKKMDDGNSVFKLDRSGPFYFISGNQECCLKGQKVTVVVLTTRNENSTLPPKGCPSPPSDQQPSLAAPPKAIDPLVSPPDVSSAPSSNATAQQGCLNTPPADYDPPVAEPEDRPLEGFDPPPVTESPIPGKDCDASIIRSDPVNVNKPNVNKPPQWKSAAPAATHLSSVLIAAVMVIISATFREFLIF